MEKRELTCIGCPLGCPLMVTMENGAVVSVTGNTCPRGDAYARTEVTAPSRIVTTTVPGPGGVLAAVLYSGKIIGDAEKQAALALFRSLPLTRYTVLVCDFANWADTAPLPCFILKK